MTLSLAAGSWGSMTPEERSEVARKRFYALPQETRDRILAAFAKQPGWRAPRPWTPEQREKQRVKREGRRIERRRIARSREQYREDRFKKRLASYPPVDELTARWLAGVWDAWPRLNLHWKTSGEVRTARPRWALSLDRLAAERIHEVLTVGNILGERKGRGRAGTPDCRVQFNIVGFAAVHHLLEVVAPFTVNPDNIIEQMEGLSSGTDRP